MYFKSVTLTIVLLVTVLVNGYEGDMNMERINQMNERRIAQIQNALHGTIDKLQMHEAGKAVLAADVST